MQYISSVSYTHLDVYKRQEKGQAHIKSTFNNTLVTLTDLQGNAISWASSGQLGFKGSRKSTPYAASMVAEEAAKKAMEHGLKTVEVYVKGPGSGREAAIRSLQAAGLEVNLIKDVTPIPVSYTHLDVYKRQFGSTVSRIGEKAY